MTRPFYLWGRGGGLTHYLLVPGLMRTIVRYQLCLVLTKIVADFQNSTNTSDTVLVITLIMMHYPDTGVLQLILE